MTDVDELFIIPSFRMKGKKMKNMKENKMKNIKTVPHQAGMQGEKKVPHIEHSLCYLHT